MDGSIPLPPGNGPGQNESGRPARQRRTGHAFVSQDGSAHAACRLAACVSPRTGRARRLLPDFLHTLLRAGIICCLVFSAGCTLRSASPGPPGPAVAGSSISRTALSAIGTRYLSGGTSPSRGFDCSGLVCWAYAQNGVYVPRTAQEQGTVGKSVGKKNLKEGDLVVFRVRGGMHTGIYTGQGKFVHSPSQGKRVREDSIASQYWQNRFVGGRRHTRLY